MKAVNMSRTRQRYRVRQWPFWALLVAWLCANTPQGAVTLAVIWAGEARTFSHQERLTATVAELLTGVAVKGVLAKAAELPEQPEREALPANVTWKVMPLQVEQTGEFLPPRLREAKARSGEVADAGALRAPPPHGPPRLG
ncbi:MAG: hypothetical protein NVV63_10330 [Opitutus sp.]|nr:hypothetical protein [Opitutus sp.]